MTLKMALIRKIKRLIGIQSPSEHMWGFKPRRTKKMSSKEDINQLEEKMVRIRAEIRSSKPGPHRNDLKRQLKNVMRQRIQLGGTKRCHK